MLSSRRVALVTGANKGIGFAIARDLCRQFSGDVVLTARDAARGQAAVQQLQAEGLSPRFHQLDINDLQSIRALRDFLKKEYGGLDVLVNNAGIAFKTVDPTPFPIQAEVTMKTNFFGTRDVCTELLPLIKPHGESDEEPKPCWFWHDLPCLPLLSSTSPCYLSLLSYTDSLLCLHWARHPCASGSAHTCPVVISALCPTGHCTADSFSSFRSLFKSLLREALYLLCAPHTLEFPEDSIPAPSSSLSLSE
uniref:Carbonyl reductase 1 n=1 Tax=Equus caballus TaxID=9796 RepID=A0A9L0RK46_HORSE